MLPRRVLFYCLWGLSLTVGCGSNNQYRPLTAIDADDAAETTAATVSEKTDSQSPASTTPENAPAAPPSAASSDLNSSADSSSQPAKMNSAKAPKENPDTPAAAAVPRQNQKEKAAPGEEKESRPDLPVATLTAMRGSLMSKPSGPPLAIKLLIPHKEFAAEGADHSLRVTFDDLDLLKVCNMEPVPPDVMDYLPDWLKKLNGQKIILRGWMFPSGRQEGISSFMFVRDNGICCFGRDPKVYDKLAVTMQPGKTTRYIAGRPFDVEATLLIEPDIEGSEEGLWWLYRLENARVIDQ